MIPKTIHYCWFGRGEKPKLAKRCIASWKKYCPDYEIIEWNEDNFNIAAYPYAAYCYRQRKWAFLSDFVRLVVVAKYGGLYFDTDVELIRNPDVLLQYNAFLGFENSQYINTGHGFGASQNHAVILTMLKTYYNIEPTKDGIYPIIGCPTLNTEALLPLGLLRNGQRQTIAGAEIFPSDYFNPYEDATGRMKQTPNTFSIHWYSKSALSKYMIIRSKLTRPLHRILGPDFFRRPR